VAAVLEIGRLLAERKGDLKRSLLILFFGGEEWGLMGSSHYVKEPLIPLHETKAVFSVDAVGGAGEGREVFLVGKTKHLSLAERPVKYLGRLELKEGKEIDRYAFDYGSDHFPFHLAGIPAIDLFSSDTRKLHTLRDRPESIDFGKLTDVTKALYWTVYEMLTEPRMP
jgi:Zn-dependent M28 family amino/carboxypeptidase